MNAGYEHISDCRLNNNKDEKAMKISSMTMDNLLSCGGKRIINSLAHHCPKSMIYSLIRALIVKVFSKWQ